VRVPHHVLIVALAALMMACEGDEEGATAPTVAQLEVSAGDPTSVSAKPTDLETRVAALEHRISLIEQGKTAAQALESDARPIYEAMKTAHKAGDYAAAQTHLARLATEFSETPSYKRSRRLEAELSLFNQPALTDAGSHIEQWFTETEIVSTDGSLGFSSGTTLVVFWERWCPSCREKMPDLQQIYDTWTRRGIQVVALTRGSRSETPQAIAEFVNSGGFSFPIALENGQIATAFKVQALPAAAVVQNGLIIWRGDAKKITDKELQVWARDPALVLDPGE
jgi:thiol-disulfide isomerase/thioredoxin